MYYPSKSARKNPGVFQGSTPAPTPALPTVAVAQRYTSAIDFEMVPTWKSTDKEIDFKNKNNKYSMWQIQSLCALSLCMRECSPSAASIPIPIYGWTDCLRPWNNCLELTSQNLQWPCNGIVFARVRNDRNELKFWRRVQQRARQKSSKKRKTVQRFLFWGRHIWASFACSTKRPNSA